MGAYLLLQPTVGKFDTEEIISYIEESDFVLKMDDQDPPAYIFMDPTSSSDGSIDQKPAALKGSVGDSRFTSQMPCVDIVDNNQIRVKLNWNDTSRNDMRYFTQWLLSNYQCIGSDFQGYEFSNNDELRNWIDMWLPRSQQ